MAIFQKKRAGEDAPAFDPARLPRHIAIILDGNGRWAKKHGLPRTAGHAVGAETVRKIANYCKDIGVEYLTLYAYSTENWKRPDDEVHTIMDIFERYIIEAIEVMKKDGIRMDFFGELSALSPRLQELMRDARAESSHHDGCQLNLCINYGGRDEILHAVRRYAELYKAGEAPELTEDISPASCIPPPSPIRISSSAPAASSACRTIFRGRAPTASSISPPSSGPTSPKPIWTRRS